MMDPGFWKKIQMGSEGSKSSKHEFFRVLAKNPIRSDIYDFLL